MFLRPVETYAEDTRVYDLVHALVELEQNRFQVERGRDLFPDVAQEFDTVFLGGDFDGNDRWPEGLDDVSTYPRLFAELIRRGWSDRDLRKLAQGNLLRVLRGAEATARRLQAARPASLATIEGLDGANP